MIRIAKQTLDEGGYTLVVAKDSCVRGFNQRGVADLVYLIENESSYINDACVADKIIGKAAAALMIKGGVREVFARVITHDAKRMFDIANIPVQYNEMTDMVENRTKTGRCPLDTLCADITNIDDMISNILQFVHNH